MSGYVPPTQLLNNTAWNFRIFLIFTMHSLKDNSIPGEMGNNFKTLRNKI